MIGIRIIFTAISFIVRTHYHVISVVTRLGIETFSCKSRENIEEKSSPSRKTPRRNRFRIFAEKSVDEKSISSAPCTSRMHPPTHPIRRYYHPVALSRTHRSFAIHSYTRLSPRTYNRVRAQVSSAPPPPPPPSSPPLPPLPPPAPAPSLAESRIPAQQRPAPTPHCVPDAREYPVRRVARRAVRRDDGGGRERSI